MKRYIKKAMAFAMAISIVAFTGCGTSYPTTTSAEYTNPSWAPAYVSGVRYYYLPDIEAYYDLSNQDFAYLDNGQWLFSSSLPSMYSNYDLYNGFSISLNRNVYQPWMHHQYYMSNYPRYYYQNRYPNAQHDGVRGFNENDRKPIITRPAAVRPPVDNRNNGNQHQNPITRPAPVTRPAQTPRYPGRNIGQPVRVTPRMREPKTINRNQPATPKTPQGARENNSNERPH